MQAVSSSRRQAAGLASSHAVARIGVVGGQHANASLTATPTCRTEAQHLRCIVAGASPACGDRAAVTLNPTCAYVRERHARPRNCNAPAEPFAVRARKQGSWHAHGTHAHRAGRRGVHRMVTNLDGSSQHHIEGRANWRHEQDEQPE